MTWVPRFQPTILTVFVFIKESTLPIAINVLGQLIPDDDKDKTFI